MFSEPDMPEGCTCTKLKPILMHHIMGTNDSAIAKVDPWIGLPRRSKVILVIATF